MVVLTFFQDKKVCYETHSHSNHNIEQVPPSQNNAKVSNIECDNLNL